MSVSRPVLSILDRFLPNVSSTNCLLCTQLEHKCIGLPAETQRNGAFYYNGEGDADGNDYDT